MHTVTVSCLSGCFIVNEHFKMYVYIMHTVTVSCVSGCFIVNEHFKMFKLMENSI